jgi:hypothetical protein
MMFLRPEIPNPGFLLSQQTRVLLTSYESNEKPRVANSPQRFWIAATIPAFMPFSPCFKEVFRVRLSYSDTLVPTVHCTTDTCV